LWVLQLSVETGGSPADGFLKRRETAVGWPGATGVLDPDGVRVLNVEKIVKLCFQETVKTNSPELQRLNYQKSKSLHLKVVICRIRLD
jgi:hypothetical protein